MEGDKFSGKTNCPETLSPDEDKLLSWMENKLYFKVLQSAILLWPSVFSVRACLYFPLYGIFHSLILSCLLTACFLWGLELELGALQGLYSSLADLFWFICLYLFCARNVCGFFCLCLCPPSPLLLSHSFQLNVFVFTGCCSVNVSFPFLSQSACLSPFSF